MEMNKLDQKPMLATWLSVARKVAWFALAHLTAYFVVGGVFLQLTAHLPEESRRALDFFAFYQPLMGVTLFSQLVRGMIIGGVCVSLQSSINKSSRPWLVLTGLVWGVGIFGSVEPLPGSFEGMLYTTTSALEHLLALAASLLQVLLMVVLLQKSKLFHKGTQKREQDAAQRVNETMVEAPSTSRQSQFVRRFTLLHVATYFLIGVIFYQISGYEEALATMEEFTLWRSLENLVLPLAIFLGQFIRGYVLAMLLLPFYDMFIKKSGGWRRLFITLWSMTFLAAVNIVPWVVQDLWLGDSPLTDFLIGPPEVTVQMLLFSLLLYFWHKCTISLPGFTMLRDVNPFKVDSR